MLLPNRHGNPSDYRYGFSGMEKDDEVKGSGNSYTTHFRQYDPRVGRWASRDRIFAPWESPYAAYRNNPILEIDPDGGWSIGHQGRGTGDRARKRKGALRKADFNFVFRSVNKNTMNFNKGLSYIPGIGVLGAVSQTLEGSRTGNANIGVKGAVDIPLSFFGGYLGKKVGALIPSDKIVGKVIEQGASILIEGVTDPVVTATVENLTSDISQTIFVDEFVRNTLLGGNIIDENGDFNKAYINKLKSKFSKENNLSLNSNDDLLKLERLVSDELNKEAKTIQEAGIKAYEKVKKDKKNKSRGSSKRAKRRNAKSNKK